MFIGHFALGFAAKRLSPEVSLGTLFFAAQFADILWPALLLLGVEQVRVVPGATAVTPLLFKHYPWSHSLLASCGWAALIGGVHFAFRRHLRGAIVVAALVVSHWLLDAVVHRPDLPVLPGGTLLVGLGLWSSPTLTLLVEVPLFLVGVWLYAGATEPSGAKGRWALWGLAAFLLAVYAANLSGGPPPGVEAVAWVGQLQWLLVAWAYWADRHRRSRVAAGREPDASRCPAT